jgi:hypothetical protein
MFMLLLILLIIFFLVEDRLFFDGCDNYQYDVEIGGLTLIFRPTGPGLQHEDQPAPVALHKVARPLARLTVNKIVKLGSPVK